MAEMIFWVRDRLKPWDAELDAAAYKAGDVITVKPDGWQWSEIELTKPEWRILRLPSASVDDLLELLQPETTVDGNTTRKRRSALDLANVPGAWASWLSDDTRAVPIFQPVFGRLALLALIRRKQARSLIPRL